MQENRAEFLPAEVHTAPPLSTRVRRPKLYIYIDRLFPTIPSRTRRRWAVVGMVALVAAVAVSLLLMGGHGDDVAPNGADGGLHGGVPSVVPTTDGGSGETASGEPITEAGDGTDAAGSDTTASDATAEAETLPSSEPSEAGSDEPSAEPGSETLPSEPPEDGGEVTDLPPSDPVDEPSVGTEAATPPEAATEGEETAPLPVPDGCFAITSQDVSESQRGAGYILNSGAALPSALPSDSPWRVDAPAVLIVNTHPYEGYGDGAAWYDPAAGGLAQTDSPNASDGVVALGAALARTLRGMGVTVIHLRLSTTAEESAAELYDRTEDMIRYYCRLYPDIGLVVDLRRSAELTEDGGILRTAGSYQGESCAQLRISVSGGRDSDAAGYDLAVALALREGLWGCDPTLSRPVWVRSGSGLVSDLTDVRVLTLEMGSAGNTYGEAQGLVVPLGRSLAEALQNFG